jgi:hypothetical protein
MNRNYDEEGTGEVDQAAQEAELLNKVRTVKTILFSGKVGDMSNMIAKDDKGHTVFNTDPDYVKLCFGSGDYVEIEVNIETGQVVGWKKPTEDDMMDAFGGKD